MSERKVLNKYYPPDFDPSKIPRIKLARNRQYTVRLMAPFNMRCVTCGEYIYKGKKFNARKEDVENEDYLGIRIYRFYIKCTRCLQEISFKTDPKNTDYEIEAGATRNFMALKLAEEQAKREEDQLKEEEANNPMKLLENRTEQSKNEIALLESLEELKDLNRRQQDIDYESMLQQFQPKESPKEKKEREEREDEEFIKSVKFSNTSIITGNLKVVEEEIIELNEERPSAKLLRTLTASDVASGSRPVINDSPGESSTSRAISKPAPIIRPTPSAKPNHTWNKSIGVLSKKNNLLGLVNINKKTVPTSSSTTTTSEVAKEDSNKATEENKNAESKVVANGLSLLSGYSDSDSNSD